MPFENYNKAENDDQRRRWIFLAMAFLFLPGYFFVSYIFNFSPMIPYNTDSTFVTPGIVVAEGICSALPKPEKFVFVSKEKFPTTDGASAVILHYQSERGLEEIMPAFLIWFNSNGWKTDPNDNLTFRRIDQTVIIRRNDAVSPNYEIYCSAKESKISFGV